MRRGLRPGASGLAASPQPRLRGWSNRKQRGEIQGRGAGGHRKRSNSEIDSLNARKNSLSRPPKNSLTSPFQFAVIGPAAAARRRLPSRSAWRRRPDGAHASRARVLQLRWRGRMTYGLANAVALLSRRIRGF